MSSLLIRRQMTNKPTGSFFIPVPDESDEDKKKVNSSSPVPPPSPSSSSSNAMDIDGEWQQIIRSRKSPSRASSPSTIGGVPVNKGFGKTTGTSKTIRNLVNKSVTGAPTTKKPYVAIGPPDDETPEKNSFNNPFRPQLDDQGYTLYQDKKTGRTSRVFEALVDFPCEFTLKIVGASEGSFAEEMVQLVADSCEVSTDQVGYTTRVQGKWTSITVKAPVQSSEMLYRLYEHVDKDPRVKFKF